MFARTGPSGSLRKYPEWIEIRCFRVVTGNERSEQRPSPVDSAPLIFRFVPTHFLQCNGQIRSQGGRLLKLRFNRPNTM